MQPLNGNDIRERFLTFFERNGHRRVASDRLVPADDPTVLFTSAGMNQFKPYFMGRKKLEDAYRGATSCQKCLRTVDLDNVGKTPSHQSFFEMLGNFSFGKYFKSEAIAWAWEFLTGYTSFAGSERSRMPECCLELPRERLWVSIHQEDDEAHALWRALGVPEERIKRFGDKDNFWPANARQEGPNGPCGPCSEIYFDADGLVCGPKSVEVWNLVFTQYDRQEDGSLKPLPTRNIDTGMGLERLTRVVQGVATNFDTDLLRPIVEAVDRAMPLQAMNRQPDGKDGRSEAWASDAGRRSRLHAIADHARATVLLIGDGVTPSNEGRGYVLRMLIRRAMRYAYRMGHDGPIITPVVPAVLEAVRGGYPELTKQAVGIQSVIQQEEDRFAQTLEAGMAKLEEHLKEVRQPSQGAGRPVLSGDTAFRLYDTFGFPLELTVDEASERGVSVDRDGFDRLMQEQRERSRGATNIEHAVFVETFASIIDQLQQRTVFLGYHTMEASATVQTILVDGKAVAEASAGRDAWVVLDRTPCYGESGGQQGDQGEGATERSRLTIVDAQRVNNTVVHHMRVVDGVLRVGDIVTLTVDPLRRIRLVRHHTATHLLNSALRAVLGPHVQQAGSLVTPEKLRFDFLHAAQVKDRELAEIESLVNDWVLKDYPVTSEELPYDEAIRQGALAFFGDKYGDRVRVISIGDVSKELCGGTHADRSGEIGLFRITHENSIASGTRRVEAVSGEVAYQRTLEQEQFLKAAAGALNIPTDRVAQAVSELTARLGRLEKELGDLRLQRVTGQAAASPERFLQTIGPLQVMTQEIHGADIPLLRKAADTFKKDTKANVIALGSGDTQAGSVSLVVACDDRAIEHGVSAADLMQHIAPIVGGRGGGRPQFAQGGGSEVGALATALGAVHAWIQDRTVGAAKR